MARKRTVVVAGVVSGVLFTASAAFAVASGLLGSTPADAVGTFERVDARPGVASQPVAARSAGTVAPQSAAAADRDDGDAAATAPQALVLEGGMPPAAPTPTDTPSAATPAASAPVEPTTPVHEPADDAAEPAEPPDVAAPASSTTTTAAGEPHGDNGPGSHEDDGHVDDSHEDD
jgi:hypothetical protein